MLQLVLYTFQLVTNVAGNQFSAPLRSDEEFVRRFLIFGNSDGIYFARQKEFICTLEPGLCRIIQSGGLLCEVFHLNSIINIYQEPVHLKIINKYRAIF